MSNSQQLIERLPHLPPMRLIHEVVAVASGESRCSTFVDEDFCGLWGDGASAGSFVSIEIVAQAAAIAIGGGDPAGKKQSGMLAQVRRCDLHLDTVPIGAVLESHVTVDVAQEGNFAVARGSVSIEDVLIAEIQLSIAIG